LNPEGQAGIQSGKAAVVKLQRLNATTAGAVVKELYTGLDGFESAVVDERTNALVLKGTPAVLKEVKGMLEKLDAAKEPSAPAK
jgi:type II secretory pathway component GspD/PulD (secretin)